MTIAINKNKPDNGSSRCAAVVGLTLASRTIAKPAWLRAFFTAVLASTLLVACGGGSESTPLDPADGATDADRFLLFLNPQYSLPAGEYFAIAATVTAGQQGAYTLTVETDEAIEEFNGSWAPGPGVRQALSGGQDPSSNLNGRHRFVLDKPGGATITLSSTVDVYLYLLDRNDSVVMESKNTEGTSVTLTLPSSQIDSESYAKAYYATIDPNNEKDTLAKWKAANGFDGGIDFDVSFRDAKDLGYGRHMRVRENTDGSLAFFVDNYSVSSFQSFSYGPLNLEALVARNRQHIIGTNAIEISPGPGGGAMFAKFYNFLPADSNGVQFRNLIVDIDGRGDKAMPGLCIVCHGGKTLPLDPDTGLFVDAGDVKGSLHPFEMETFEFSDQSPFTRAEQEAMFRDINLLVLSAYPKEFDTTAGDGKWSGAGATEIVDSMYGGPGAPVENYLDDHVPVGWIPNPDTGSPPAGVDVLYREVVGPNCVVCHSKRGTTLQDIVDFSSFEKFIQYADLIEYYVFEAGSMPASRLNFEAFWGSPGKAALLGSFLPGFRHGAADGTTLKPGRPIADPGPDRKGASPLTLSATGSLFADSYRWEIVSQPLNGEATFAAPGTATLTSNLAQPRLSAAANGVYTVRLVVANATSQSSPVDVEITIDSTAPAQAELRFSDIEVILDKCTFCHSAAGSATMQNDVPITGVPAFWDGDENPHLYRDVLQRINFRDPERSQILLKPANYGQRDDPDSLDDNLHFGGLRTNGFDINGFDPTGNRDDYDTILNWILKGAVR